MNNALAVAKLDCATCLHKKPAMTARIFLEDWSTPLQDVYPPPDAKTLVFSVRRKVLEMKEGLKAGPTFPSVFHPRRVRAVGERPNRHAWRTP